MSFGMFCPLGLFVPWDVLSAGCFVLGRFVLGPFECSNPVVNLAARRSSVSSSVVYLAARRSSVSNSAVYLAAGGALSPAQLFTLLLGGVLSPAPMFTLLLGGAHQMGVLWSILTLLRKHSKQCLTHPDLSVMIWI